MATILVTSGEERSALAAVRSLGRAEHEVVVCSETGRSLAGASRWASADRRAPSPLEAPAGFAGAVADLVRKHSCDVVLPVTDPAVLSVLQHRDVLPERVSVPFPSLQSYRSLASKSQVARAASTVGIAVPTQERVASAEAVDQVDPSEIGFPVVVKPDRSVVADGHQGMEKTRVTRAFTPGELHKVLRSLHRSHFPVLLQEHVPGSGAGVFLLRWGGRIFARFAHRRLREKPPSGGVSVYRESVDPPERLFEASERLLEHFGWQGVAMVEYRVDARDGVPYLMEVNGRLWGSLQLAVDAGVDFPRLLVALAEGEDVEPVTRYRAGLRCRWEWGDVDHLIARLRGQPPGDAPDGRPRRLRALSDFLVLWRPGDRPEVLRASDPAPFLRETRAWLRNALGGSGDTGVRER